jgi:hypothetical protein
VDRGTVGSVAGEENARGAENRLGDANDRARMEVRHAGRGWRRDSCRITGVVRRVRWLDFAGRWSQGRGGGGGGK